LESVSFRIVRYANLIAYILGTLVAYLSSKFEFGLPALNGVIATIVLVFIVNAIFKALNIDDYHEIDDEVEEINA